MDNRCEEPMAQGSDTSEESNWLDVEPDVERVEIVSLFDSKVFATLPEMLQYCKQQYGFDLVQNVQRLQLDFLGAIKLINFIRLQVNNKSTLPAEISIGDIEDDGLLKPVLSNDAAIFSLDEVLGSSTEAQMGTSDAMDDSYIDLQKNNRRLEVELASIRESFANYRLAVEETLDRRWGVNDIPGPSRNAKEKDPSGYYFESYAAHGMTLADSITFSQLTHSRHTRDHAQGHRSYGCISGLHIRE